MDKNKVKQLLIDYANASFRCGVFSGDDEFKEAYDKNSKKETDLMDQLFEEIGIEK